MNNFGVGSADGCKWFVNLYKHIKGFSLRRGSAVGGVEVEMTFIAHLIRLCLTANPPSPPKEKALVTKYQLSYIARNDLCIVPQIR
jgi:hypothetical protein